MTDMNFPSEGEKPIELAVFYFIKEYVERKTENKSGIKKPEESKNWNPPQKYREYCEKICSDAFYRLRACKNHADFMQYFSDSLCSVPHNLSRDNYQSIARYLTVNNDSWQDVKSLAMLALSKFSYFRNDAEAKTEDTNPGTIQDQEMSVSGAE